MESCKCTSSTDCQPYNQSRKYTYGIHHITFMQFMFFYSWSLGSSYNSQKVQIQTVAHQAALLCRHQFWSWCLQSLTHSYIVSFYTNTLTTVLSLATWTMSVMRHHFKLPCQLFWPQSPGCVWHFYHTCLSHDFGHLPLWMPGQNSDVKDSFWLVTSYLPS